MAKNPDTTCLAQKLVQATASASYGEMSGGNSGSRFSSQVPEILVVPVAHASAVSSLKGKAPI